jgi:hypothetical protein
MENKKDIPKWVKCEECKAEACWNCCVKSGIGGYINFEPKQ